MRVHTLLRSALIAPAVLVLITIAQAFNGTGTLVSQGITRTFIYHAPGASVAPGLPLVIVYHGTGGNGAGMEATTGFDAVADANNFIVVYPNSTTIGGDIQWNVYADNAPGHAGVGDANATDDVVFTDDLIDWFCSNDHIDPAHIYATGLSNGGFMTYLLALARPNKIAAFAPCSGNLWGDDAYLLNAFGTAFTPVAIYHVHGDPDPVVDYPDAVHDPNQWTWPLSSFGSSDCGNAVYNATTLTGNIQQLTWCDGSAGNGKKVEMIRVPGLGHAWANVAGYNAATAIWEFFSGYAIASPALNCAVGINDVAATKSALTVHPVPADNELNFSREVAAGTAMRIVDTQGREVWSGTSKGGTLLELPTLRAGAYRLEVSTPQEGRTVLGFVKR